MADFNRNPNLSDIQFITKELVAEKNLDVLLQFKSILSAFTIYPTSRTISKTLQPNLGSQFYLKLLTITMQSAK